MRRLVWPVGVALPIQVGFAVGAATQCGVTVRWVDDRTCELEGPDGACQALEAMWRMAQQAQTPGEA